MASRRGFSEIPIVEPFRERNNLSLCLVRERLEIAIAKSVGAVGIVHANINQPFEAQISFVLLLAATVSLTP